MTELVEFLIFMLICFIAIMLLLDNPKAPND